MSVVIISIQLSLFLTSHHNNALCISISAQLGLITKGRIEAYITIYWLGGEQQRYGFVLTLPSVSDMVKALIGLVKDRLLGGDRRKREIMSSFFETIGSNTVQLFKNNDGEIFTVPNI